MLKMGNTMLLATVVSAQDAGPDVDFMPLSVDYKEKFASVGRFPGGFTRREGKSSDYEILVSRLVDRALRPLFPDDYHAETFVQVTLYSADEESMPDALAGLAASAALAVSDIPFHGPISEVRVARIQGEFVINPTASALKEADLDIMVGATYENIMMVEGEMNEVSEKEMLDAIKFAHAAIKEQCVAQQELAAAVGKEKRTYCHEVNDEELRKDIWDKCYQKAYDVGLCLTAGKDRRSVRSGQITYFTPDRPDLFGSTSIQTYPGSSSMATVCAGTLALMDAGVPMKKPVTGIAMGLITDKGCAKYAVLSDILGDEDHLGDMD